MVIDGDSMLFNEDLIMIDPLVNKHFAIENDPVEIVDFPIKNGDLPQPC